MKLTTHAFFLVSGDLLLPGGLVRLMGVTCEPKSELAVVAMLDMEAPPTKVRVHRVADGDVVQSQWQYVGSYFAESFGKLQERLRHYYVDFPQEVRVDGTGKSL